MKTKAQIINETVEFYSADTSRRSINARGNCFYLHPANGNKCAVGRCLKNPSKEASMSVSFLFGSYKERYNPEFLPEYEGHDLDFWMDLQGFHDSSENWDKYGLTAGGQKELKRLSRYE